MTYYRVKEAYDNKPRLKLKNGRYVYNGVFIRNELYTLREMQNHFPHIEGMYDEINMPKSNTYKCFGARFEMGRGANHG